MSKHKIEEEIKILDKKHSRLVEDMDFYWEEAKFNESKIFSSKSKIEKLNLSKKVLHKILIGLSAITFAFAIFVFAPLVLMSSGLICITMISNVLHDKCITKNEQNIKDNEELLKINKEKQEKLFKELTAVREKRYFLKDELMLLNSKNDENNIKLSEGVLKNYNPKKSRGKENKWTKKLLT